MWPIDTEVISSPGDEGENVEEQDSAIDTQLNLQEKTFKKAETNTLNAQKKQ